MVSSNRILDLFGVALPILQAPMAGSSTPEMAVAVSNAGGLGSLPSALYSETQLRAALDVVRAGTKKPINLNFFSHQNPPEDAAAQAAWRQALRPYYVQEGLDPDQPIPAAGRAPFNADLAKVVEDYRPEVVSFHFGLPAPELVERVRRTGAKIISSATTVAEAQWLEARGVDAVIAMGFDAGGHRGSFLTPDSLAGSMSQQIGTFSLVPRIVDAVSVPVIAAGGIADRRGVLAAFALGAEAALVGTAYLLTPEAAISSVYREALQSADEVTTVTNVFTGRPARGIVNRLIAELGPLSDLAPPFPTAGAAVLPLRKAAEAAGRGDYSSMWAGQAFRTSKPMTSTALTRKLAGLDA